MGIIRSCSRRGVGLVASALTVVLAAACGSSTPAAPAAAPAPTASAAPTSAAPAPTPATPVAATTRPASPVAAPTPVAPRALAVTAFADPGDGDKVAVVRSPTGNIICDFAVDDSEAGCGVMSMIDPDAGVKWWVDLSGDRPQRLLREDAPWSGNVNGSVQVVEYGTTVATGHYACRSEQAGMTCWNTRTGHGAHLARAGIDLVRMPVGEVAVAAPGSALAAGAGRAPAGEDEFGDVLSADVPGKLVPNGRAGRLVDGVYEDFDPEVGGEMVSLRNGDRGSGWTERVRRVDLAGDSRPETVGLLARTNGGVPWPDGVVVWDGSGRVLWSWETGDAGGDPRGNSTLTRATGTSVDVVIPGTGPSAAGGNQSGESTYRLSKAAGGPTWTLVSRR